MIFFLRSRRRHKTVVVAALLLPLDGQKRRKRDARFFSPRWLPLTPSCLDRGSGVCTRRGGYVSASTGEEAAIEGRRREKKERARAFDRWSRSRAINRCHRLFFFFFSLSLSASSESIFRRRSPSSIRSRPPSLQTKPKKTKTERRGLGSASSKRRRCCSFDVFVVSASGARARSGRLFGRAPLPQDDRDAPVAVHLRASR